MTAKQRFQFALVVLLWSFTWIAIRDQVLSAVPAIWSVAFRFLVAGGVMAVACIATGRSLRLGSRGFAFAVAVAMLQFVGNFNLVYEVERHVTSGLPAVVFALLVVPNAILARIVLGQRLDPRVALGAVLGIAGVLLLFRDTLVVPGALDGSGARVLVMMLAAVLCASCANVMQATPAGRAVPAWPLLAHAMLYAGIIDAALAWVIAGPPPTDFSARYLGALGYLAVGGSAIAFLVYYNLIRAIGPARAAYTSLAIPFVAMTVSTIFEGYRWTGWTVAGAVLALAGVALALGGAQAGARPRSPVRAA